MHKEPLLILCIFFILGIVLQDYFSFEQLTLIIVLIASVLSLMFFFIKGYYFTKIRPVILAFLFFAVGFFVHFLHSEVPQLPTLSKKETVVFKLHKKLNSNEKNRRYEIVAWKDKISFLSVLSVPKELPPLDYSNYYKASLFINPLQKSYSDFQFDYTKYLSRKGIYFQSYLPQDFENVERNDLTFGEKIRQKRLELLKKIDEATLEKRTREFAKGIILADRTEMDQETIRDFRNSGTMHLLAISGTHVAIIFGVILLVLNLVISEKYRKSKIVVALVLIWLFAVFIDYGNSVVRSCIMITCYYIFVILQRKTDLLHSMSLAAFFILFADSNQIFEVGFQLSFAAVLGIYWFNQPIVKRLFIPKNKFQNVMLNTVSISISAQLATFPLVVFYFHQYSALSILANLAIIPFAEIVIVFSLLMVIFTALSVQILFLNTLFDGVINYTLKAVHFFGNLDFALQTMIPMTILEVVILFIILYLLRFIIVNFSIKNSSRLFFFVLLYISIRILLNYEAGVMNEVVRHEYFKENIVSVKRGNLVKFYMSNDKNQTKIRDYIIFPYLTSRRTTKFSVEIVDQKFLSSLMKNTR